MSRHAYPTSAMLGDYARAAAGFLPSIATLGIIPVGMVETVLLTGLAALFAVFGIRTALRHGTSLELADGVLRASGPVRASISFRELDRMSLGYYCTRRDGREGWMQLELRAGRSILRLDSRIEGFAQLAAVSARAADARGLTLNAATVANLQALGLKSRAAEPGFQEAAGEAR